MDKAARFQCFTPHTLCVLSGFFFSPYIFENNGYGMIGKPHVIFTICIQPLRLTSRPIIGQEIEFFKK